MKAQVLCGTVPVLPPVQLASKQTILPIGFARKRESDSKATAAVPPPRGVRFSVTSIVALPVSLPAVSGSLWHHRLISDAQELWQALHRMVLMHPLVKSSLRHSTAALPLAAFASPEDLTQDLYLTLLEKDRFTHYLQSGMTDAEIDREIFQIELSNLLVGRLRKRQPESYRIVKRVSEILLSDARFQALSANSQRGPQRYRYAVDELYGLKQWENQKPTQDSARFSELTAALPVCPRDLRKAGRSGDTQIIITTSQLADLLESILRTIDSPATLRVLRQLVLSKLPVYDATVTSIDAEQDESNGGRAEARLLRGCLRDDVSPETLLLRRERETLARRAACQLLEGLQQLSRGNRQRFERFCRVLWHSYLDSAAPSQLLLAEWLGISDSSVSNYRQRIEQELRQLALEPDLIAPFRDALTAQLACHFGARAANTTAIAPNTKEEWAPKLPVIRQGSLHTGSCQHLS